MTRMSEPDDNTDCADNSNKDDEHVSPILGLFVVGTFVLFLSFVVFFFFIRPLLFG